VITVCPGTYRENLNYKGKAVSIVSRDGPQVTTIDGTLSGPVVTFASREGSASVLKGFTITNGERGVYCYNSSPTIEKCIITQNNGGIYLSNSSPTIRQCTIRENTATSGGGLYVTSDYLGRNSLPHVDQCIIQGNQANNNGGGIYCYQSSPVLVNTTISGNEALNGDGGGIAARYYCDFRLTNCTITNNVARYGDGLYLYLDCDPLITNTIIWNVYAIYQTSYCDVTATYSDIRGGFPGIGNIKADPLFVEPENGDFHLQAGSPCIDTGILEGAPEKDFEGESRPVGDAVDMGVDEYYAGPEIEITFPIDGQAFDVDLIDVVGTVNTDDLFVTINGESSAVEDHHFSLENFLLSPGTNVLTTLAEDRYSDTAQDEIVVTYAATSGSEQRDLQSGGA